MKFIYIIAAALLGFVGSVLATPKNLTDLPMLVCPDVNQLQVDIMKGTATAPGGWSGQSTLSLSDKTNWQHAITMINALNSYSDSYYAECQYMMGPEADVVDIQKVMPSGYQLYDVTYGVQPTGDCWVGYPQLNAGEYKDCYWYSNPVLKK